MRIPESIRLSSAEHDQHALPAHAAPSAGEGPTGQAGMTLIETLLALVIGIIIFVPFTAWVVVSIQQQAAVRATNIDTFGLGLTNTYLPRDIANSRLAVTETASDGTLRAAGAIVDCIGGNGSGGTVLAATITAGNRRVVYATTSDPDGPGLALWRRECPNLSSASDATFNEATQLNAPAATNPGYIAPLTPGNNGSSVRLATRVDSIDATCPTTSGLGQATDCSSVKFSARLVGSTRTIIIEGSRRIDSYYPPDTPPKASFTIDPYPVEAGINVNLDASESLDLRGESLTYYWKIGGVALAPTTDPVLVHTFPSTGSVLVELVVRNASGIDSARTLKTVNVVTARPAIELTGAPVAIRNSPWQPQATYRSYGTGNTLGSLTIDWGDGSPVQTLALCAGQTTCTPTLPTHTYTSGGSRIVKFGVADSLGQTRTVVQVVATEGEIYYASIANGKDNATCGVSTDPCKTIGYALTRAQATGRTQVDVAASSTLSYPRFDVVAGISVAGGFAEDFMSASAAPTRVVASKAGGLWSAVRANGTTATTAITNLELVGASTGTDNSQVLLVENGARNITFDSMKVTGGSGRNATGVLVTSASVVTFVNPTIASGSSFGVADSTYGMRVVGLSTVTVNGGLITAAGANAGADSNHTAPSGALAGCNGGNGGNASGPSSPGSGAGACGTYGNNRTPGGGGKGGKYSGGGDNGSSGAGGAPGGGGGCGSLFGCGGNAGGGGGGAGGAAGGAGAAGVHNLSQASDLYTPTFGGTGAKGGAGGGGGGGGGGKSASASGGGGGSGGAGGEGGDGATGPGQGGGGSFGVYVNDATVVLNNVTVTAAAGGKGGSGSTGGNGAAGGNGGSGGEKSCCSAGGGGGGGGGGAGGGGGGAGGGAGGPSISVYHNGTGTLTVSGGTLNRAVTAAAGGAGGLGGNGPNGGAAGSGTQSAGNGSGGGKGANGTAGSNGQAGQQLRIWNNGTTTS